MRTNYCSARGSQAELYETLGTIYRRLGKFDLADSLLHAALEGRRSLGALGESGPPKALWGSGRALLAGYEILTKQVSPPLHYLQGVRSDLGYMYDVLGDKAKAAKFREEFAANEPKRGNAAHVR
jgi:tetratricopeptide (TPR) repeat protein